ncbi:hypothetical protein ON05_016480 [Acaryochloris sp. CCMEE 5410]|nr:hypothetical protein ON05_016480 [Acaryochloris sp. CCMEE 5410]
MLIDTPPNWNFFAQRVIYATDVVLIPTKHNNIYSLKNAVDVVHKFIPEIQTYRKERAKGKKILDNGPIALPIFWNGERRSNAREDEANAKIKELISHDSESLRPYFFPDKADKVMHEIPEYANIANAAFSSTPAVFINRQARQHYANLARDYFLQ